MEIKLDICKQCAVERQWKEKIFEKLKLIYPEVFEQYRKQIGINADHSFWILHKELWDNYKQRCLVSEYDDMNESICKKHLIELIKDL